MISSSLGLPLSPPSSSLGVWDVVQGPRLPHFRWRSFLFLIFNSAGSYQSSSNGNFLCHKAHPCFQISRNDKTDSMTSTDAQSSRTWLTTTTTVLYYVVVYPILLLFKALWYILTILSTPFLYIGRVLIRLSTIPWRLFTRFEVSLHFVFLQRQAALAGPFHSRHPPYLGSLVFPR